MRRHLAYIKYLILHKAFVFYAGWKIKAPLWRLIIHDYSKLLPAEWLPYARTFFNPDGSKRDWNSRTYDEKLAFDRAWLHHQHHNPHHWQHWVLKEDGGDLRAVPMPEKFVREMCADWCGAGRAITGRWEFMEWYRNERHKMVLHPITRAMVDECLSDLDRRIHPRLYR